MDINDPRISKKEYSKTMLWCFLLGPLGAHRFYVNRYWSAIFQLLTLGGLLIWVSIDMCNIITGKFEDSEGKLIIDLEQLKKDNERNKKQ